MEKEQENPLNENEINKLTPSQTINIILTIFEAFGAPFPTTKKVRKLCWHLADSEPQGNGNGKQR
jgi:hypothetical protein